MKRSYGPSPSLRRAVAQVISRQNETKATIITSTEAFLSTLSSPVAGNSIVLNNLGSGTNQASRIGNKVNAKFINVRGAVFFPSDSPTIYTKVFILMCNEDDDPINDLLETNAAVFGAAGNDFSAIYARVNTTKYKVLGTRLLKTGTDGGLLQTATFNITSNLKGQTITYENNSGNSAASNKKILIHYYSRRADNDESLGTVGDMTWNSKFYFTDM